MTASCSSAVGAGEGAAPAREGAAAKVLVVDDGLVDRRLAGSLVESLGYQVAFADNGATALAAVERDPPQAVLTDLQMPEMDGLELVGQIRSRYPLVPVILMTAHGSEEIAIQALQKGASSYVPKKLLNRDLGEILERVLTAARGTRQRQRLLECMTRMESDFVLENDPALIATLVNFLQDNLVGMKLGDETDRIRVGIALEEALVNALYHGNLEVSSELRQQDDRAYYQTAEERRCRRPYSDRRVHIHVDLSHPEAVYIIRDEGPGFDPSSLPDPTDPENLEKLSGRGLLLIRTFMDEVSFNPSGNQITMVKRRPAAG